MPEETVFKALLIGNSTYPNDPHNLPDLKGPANDVRLLEETLTHPQVGLHKKDNVKTLVDGTREEVLVAVEDFFASAGRRDQLLLYYSGHGRLDISNNLYLCARDSKTNRLVTTAISDHTISTMINESSAPATVLILDCCHSGSFKGGEIPESLRGKGRFLLTSCRTRDLSEDAREIDGTSAFTRCLAEALLNADIEGDKNGWISLDEIYTYVLRRLEATTKQIPQRSFDKTVGDVAISRAAGSAVIRDVEFPPPPSAPEDRVEPPVLNLSETSIEIHGVKAGEVLQPEIIDVYNTGGGLLDWEVSTEDSWITIECFPEKGAFSLILKPSPGNNRGTVTVRDKGRGGIKKLRVFVQMEEASQPPKLRVSETLLDFGTVSVGAQVPRKTIRLMNEGGGNLEPQVCTADAWINVNSRGQEFDVTIDTAAAANYQGVIRVSSNGGSAEIAVRAKVETGPILSLSAKELNFGQIYAGEEYYMDLNISNVGQGLLNWRYECQCDPFVVNPTESGLQVRLKTSAGSYSGLINILSNGGDTAVRVTAEVVPFVQENQMQSNAPDISGRWNFNGGYLIVSGTSPRFQYVEYNLIGVVVGQGQIFVNGSVLSVQGQNVLAGVVGGELLLSGNQMSGTLGSLSGMGYFTFFRG